jgi:hypothetical protein
MKSFHPDAFSSGQIGSKIWLCEELERLNWKSKLTDIYAGWYATTAFLLLSRGKFEVERIASYDVDPACESVADTINENWVWQSWKFKAFTADCNFVESSADLVINTSTEHFDSMQWFDNIKPGTRVILQSNNMPHDDHSFNMKSLDEFADTFKLSQYVFEGSKRFVYPDWSFSRYMIIGIK